MFFSSAIAANRPVCRQVGEIALRTMSAAGINSNTRPEARRTDQPDQGFHRAVGDDQSRNHFHAERNIVGEAFELNRDEARQHNQVRMFRKLAQNYMLKSVE